MYNRHKVFIKSTASAGGWGQTHPAQREARGEDVSWALQRRKARLLPVCLPAGLRTISTLVFSLCSSYLQSLSITDIPCLRETRSDQCCLAYLWAGHILCENSPPVTWMSHHHRAAASPTLAEELSPGDRWEHPGPGRLRTVAFRQLCHVWRIRFKVAKA